MAINLNAKTTGVGGLETSADNSGEINIQSGGTTVMNVTSSGVAVTGSFSQNGAVYSTQPTFRNLIINGDMQIAQRGTSATGLTNGDTGYHTVDRWKFQHTGTVTYAVTMSQDTDVPTGQGFSNSVKYDITTAQSSLSAGDSLLFSHYFEGQMLQHLKKGTANAESVTLSFWVKSNKTGTYTTELLDADNSRGISKSYTIDSADTWEKKSLTFAGDTTGAFVNDNNTSLALIWWLGAGTTFTSGTLATSWEATNNANRVSSSNVNLADSTSNYINITGIQLEVGSTATDFENLPYDVQLARCQRYYYHLTDDTSSELVGAGYWGTTTSARGAVYFPVTMRTSPSLSYSSGSHFKALIPGVAFATSTAIGIYKNSEASSLLSITTSGGTTGQGTHLEFYSSPATTTYLGFSAEL